MQPAGQITPLASARSKECAPESCTAAKTAPAPADQRKARREGSAGAAKGLLIPFSEDIENEANPVEAGLCPCTPQEGSDPLDPRI